MIYSDILAIMFLATAHSIRLLDKLNYQTLYNNVFQNIFYAKILLKKVTLVQIKVLIFYV